VVGLFAENGAAHAAATEDSCAGHGQMTMARINIGAIAIGAVLALSSAGICFAQSVPAVGAPNTTGAVGVTGAPGVAAVAPHDWQSLSPQQQQLLQGYRDNWHNLPPERQQALAKGSDRWLGMTPEQREGAQQRFNQWRAMPPDQRQLLRQRWQQFKSLPPDEQQHVRDAYHQFRQLPSERRQELRQQWHQMSPEQRRGAIERHRAAHPSGHPPR
jgi:hypothetical protein